MCASTLWGCPALSSQVWSFVPTVSITSVLSPSQWPTEYPYQRDGTPSLVSIFFGNSCFPSIQTYRQILWYWCSTIILSGMVPKASPLVSKTVFRGIPSGSHVFIGSFECPVPTSVSGLLRLNNFCP